MHDIKGNIMILIKNIFQFSFIKVYLFIEKYDLLVIRKKEFVLSNA